MAAGSSRVTLATYVTAFYPRHCFPRKLFARTGVGRKLTISPRCKLLRLQVTHFPILAFFDVLQSGQ